MSRRAAYRYAKATIELAQEQNKLEAVYRDMELIHQTIDQNKELNAVLISPVVKLSTKLDIVVDVFKQTDQLVQELFKTLATNNRIDILILVAVEFISKYKDLHNIQEATVVTATALTPEVEAKVQETIKNVTGYSAKIKNEIDESILGGFILKLKDLQFDASAQGNLNALKREFLN
ncbi:MAG: ATP synthase F1 subunit delta [Psychroflexus halocasei]